MGKRGGTVFDVGVSLMLGLASCGPLPKDSIDTWERVQSEKVLRVAAAPQPPWVHALSGASPEGAEVELVRAFAKKHGLRIEWMVASQMQLAEWLHARRAEVGIGGFDQNTPIDKWVAFTQPYVKAPGLTAEGKDVSHVMAAAPGESRLLFELDKFLLLDPAGRAVAARYGKLP